MSITLSLRRVAMLVAPASVALLVAGCSASSDTAATPSTKVTKTPTTAAARLAASGAVTVTTTEYAFAPTAITAKAGKLKITLDNKGTMTHELVVLRTSRAADALKVGAGGRVSEKTSIGEVSETAAGATKSSTLTLKAGSYVFVCNIRGHYAGGMRGTLTVQ